MTPPLIASHVTNQLIAAIKADDVEALQTLFDAHQIDINSQFRWNTPIFPGHSTIPETGFLHFAVKQNSHKAIEWLAQRGIDLESQAKFTTINTFSPLGLAAMLINNEPIHKEKLIQTIAIILHAGASPDTLLVEGARSQNLFCVRHAIEAGANIDSDAGHASGWNALHFATAHLDVPMMEYLLGRHANINTRHKAIGAYTAFMIATVGGETDAMQLLLKHNADPSLLTGDGASIFHVAAETLTNHAAVLDILMSQSDKLDLNLINQPAPNQGAKTSRGKTPLAYARHLTKNYNQHLLAAFVRHGADWRELDANGQSILHQLISPSTSLSLSLQICIIESLLGAGVDPFLQNKQGITAYEAARSERNIEGVFINHCEPLRHKALHFNPAADPLFDAGGKPTGLLWYACYEHLLTDMLTPARWAGQEKALLAAKLAIAKALPEAHVKKYDAILDPTALRRSTAPKPSSHLNRYLNNPTERQLP